MSFSRTIKKRGFTLVEVLVVIAIIGVLSAITVVAYESALESSRDQQRKTDISTIANALNQYYLDNKSFPMTEVSTGGTPIFSASFQLDANNRNGCNISNPSTYFGSLTPNYISSIPQDPKNKSSISTLNGSCSEASQDGQYLYAALDSDGTTPIQNYVLAATMERTMDYDTTNTPNAAVIAPINKEYGNTFIDIGNEHYYQQAKIGQ